MLSRLLSDALNVYTVSWFPPQLVFSPSILFSLCCGSLLFHEFYIIIPAEFSVGLSLRIWRANSLKQPDISLSSLSVMHTDKPTGFISHLPEWNLKHKLITVIQRGLALTLSHRAPGIINSP